MGTAEDYRRFATAEARGSSACYEAWAVGVADDDALLSRLEEVTPRERQPNLLFAAARFVGIPAGPFEAFRDAVLDRWDEVREVMRTHRTQTNEPGRCAVLLPVLAALPQPLALLEVGASAGLCLYPDRFAYRYDAGREIHPRTGRGAAVIECVTDGAVPLPEVLPEVVWRAGIDLHPLDVADMADVRWLETLVWPEQDDRRARLRAAMAVAREKPPHLVAGDLTERLGEVAAQAPAGATLVVFHSAVLSYLDRASRDRFTAAVRALPACWVANEARGVLPFAEGALPPSPDPGTALFVLEPRRGAARLRRRARPAPQLVRVTGPHRRRPR